MADTKPDHYQVLGIAKTATKAEIKTAYQRVAMKNHPDMVKNKKDMTQAQKDEAIAKFKLATEAEKVLSDDRLRAAYDGFGHKGVENALAGKGASSGQSYEDAMGKVTRRGPMSEDDLMDFFGKAKDRRERDEAKEETSDGLTSEQRREKARQERLKNRSRGSDSPPETTTTTPAVTTRPTETVKPTEVFQVVAEKVSDTAQKLKNGVELPLSALEKFRDNLSDFLGEVDNLAHFFWPARASRS